MAALGKASVLKLLSLSIALGMTISASAQPSPVVVPRLTNETASYRFLEDFGWWFDEHRDGIRRFCTAGPANPGLRLQADDRTLALLYFDLTTDRQVPAYLQRQRDAISRLPPGCERELSLSYLGFLQDLRTRIAEGFNAVQPMMFWSRSDLDCGFFSDYINNLYQTDFRKLSPSQQKTLETLLASYGRKCLPSEKSGDGRFDGELLIPLAFAKKYLTEALSPDERERVLASNTHIARLVCTGEEMFVLRRWQMDIYKALARVGGRVCRR